MIEPSSNLVIKALHPEIPVVIRNSAVTLFESAAFLPFNCAYFNKFIARRCENQWLVRTSNELDGPDHICVRLPLGNLDDLRLFN